MGMRKIQPESSQELYGDMPMTAKSTEAKVYYPTTGFDNKTLPEAKDWEVGKTYRVTLDIKMKGMSLRKGADGVERGNYDFDIVAVDPGDGPLKAKNTRYTK